MPLNNVVTVALHCASMDNDDDDEELEHPSAAFSIKIIRIVNIKYGTAVRSSDAKIREESTEFEVLMRELSNKISDIAHKLLRELRVQKPSQNVKPEDLQKIPEVNIFITWTLYNIPCFYFSKLASLLSVFNSNCLNEVL